MSHEDAPREGAAVEGAKLRIKSFKLRFVDAHARIVPLTDASGCPFAGPGVDVRGDPARAVFAEARAISAWFAAREPGVTLRTFSFDLTSGRALATIEDAPRPRVIVSERDPELVAAACALAPSLATLAAVALSKRAQILR